MTDSVAGAMAGSTDSVNPGLYTVGGTVQANEGGVYMSRQADGELLQLCKNLPLPTC